jgi:hypothetical protein
MRCVISSVHKIFIVLVSRTGTHSLVLATMHGSAITALREMEESDAVFILGEGIRHYVLLWPYDRPLKPRRKNGRGWF